MIPNYKGLYIPQQACPTFSWIISQRVCNPYMDSDAVIFVTGKRGSGKSLLSISLAESISKHLARINGGLPTDYFRSDHIKTVSKMGGLEILSGEDLLKEHQVFVVDDAQISISSRRSQTNENNACNDLQTICRPFKSVLIYNSVFHANIDKGTRSLADYIINVVHLDTFTKQSVAKVYTYEVTGGKEYRKYLTWIDPKTHIKYRIKFFVGGLPSKELLIEYNKMRKDNSAALVRESREKYLQNKEQKDKIKKSRIDSVVEDNRDAVLRLKGEKKSIRAICRELGLTDHQVNRCLMPKAN